MTYFFAVTFPDYAGPRDGHQLTSTTNMTTIPRWFFLLLASSITLVSLTASFALLRSGLSGDWHKYDDTWAIDRRTGELCSLSHQVCFSSLRRMATYPPPSRPSLPSQ